MTEGVSDSPFKGKSLQECQSVLQDIGARLMDPAFDEIYFVVMDAQTLEDGATVLLVTAEDGQELKTMRVEFEVANAALLALSVGFGQWPQDLIVRESG